MDIVLKTLIKGQIAETIEGVTGWEREVVAELPASGEAGVVYLTQGDDGVYDEYVWISNDYVKIGTHLDIRPTNTTTDVDYILGKGE